MFGPRVVEAIERGQDGPASTGAMRSVLGTDAPGVIPGVPVPAATAAPRRPPAAEPRSAADERAALQKAMTFGAGVRRDVESLGRAGQAVRDGPRRRADQDGVAWAEVRNLADVAATIVRAAAAREETRGAHTREDFPATDPALRARFLHGA